MIVGSIESVSKQVHQFPNIRKALSYLKELEPSQIEDDRYSVIDPIIFAIFTTYLTERPLETIDVEGHRKFIDIYLMLEGSEQVGWISIDKLDDLSEYDEKGDVWKKQINKERLSFVTLHKGDAAVLFPEDAHAAQFAKGVPIHARKVIMKIAV